MMGGSEIVPAGRERSGVANRWVAGPAGTGITLVALANISNGSLPAKIRAILSETASIAFQVSRSMLVSTLPESPD
jgi:hypothetical protein